MKFICDVHISYKLVRHLKHLGFETLHVNDLRASLKTPCTLLFRRRVTG